MNVAWLKIPTGRGQNMAEELNRVLPRKTSTYWSEFKLNPQPPNFKSDVIT